MAERSAKQLGLSKADLPNSIIEVIATLSKSGFEAYIVGGGVRDNLLGLNPKDFDAVTDAKPHEIKDLFGKRCRIIGRRFQLAHVYSGRDMIEVATYRAPPSGNAHTTNDGMIVRDNVWGDIKQDFARRDFSINALYYQPIKGVVHDFCNALEDIKSKTLRLLGHAPVRIEEDPVRLLRALRFKAKLGFDFDKELSEQFHDNNWALLEQVSPHRLYDESQKMFTGGYLVPLLPLLFEFGAIRHLIIYPPESPTALVNQVAINTDKRIAQGKSINPAFFYAALLWDNYLYQLAKFKKKNMPFHDAQLQAASKVIDRQRIKTAIPRFAEQFIRDIWLMQPKLANPRVKQISQLADHPRFRAAFDFLLLREQCNDAANPLSESTNGMGEWWQTYQTLSDKQKQQAIDEFAGASRRGAMKRGRNRSRNRGKALAQNDIRTTTDVTSDSSSDDKKVFVESQHKPKKRQDHFKPDADGSVDTKSGSRGKSNPSSRTQGSHYAREREQLQQLSLSPQASQSAEDDLPPEPLFTISADKMAEQVPQQIALTQSVRKSAQSVASGNATKEAGSSDDRAKQQRPVQDIEKLSDSEAVLIPKLERVPSKRRRRQPSEALYEAHHDNHQSGDDAKSDTTKALQASTTGAGAKTDPVLADSKSTQAVTQQAAKSSSKRSRDQKPSKSAATDVLALSDIQKSDRVPAKRRRRKPSSNTTVTERLKATVS